MEDDQKRLNCSFIGFSSDESSDTSPSKSSIEKTPSKRNGDLTLMASQMTALTHSHFRQSGKTIICYDFHSNDKGLEPEQRPNNNGL